MELKAGILPVVTNFRLLRLLQRHEHARLGRKERQLTVRATSQHHASTRHAMTGPPHASTWLLRSKASESKA